MNYENLNPIVRSIIMEYYNKFPEPYKSQAIYNLKNFPFKYGCKINNIKDSLSEGFDWSQTLEGAEYWKFFHNSLIIKK